jgi:hypothetical protein
MCISLQYQLVKQNEAELIINAVVTPTMRSQMCIEGTRFFHIVRKYINVTLGTAFPGKILAC